MESRILRGYLYRGLVILVAAACWGIPQAIGLTSNPPTLGAWKTVGTTVALVLCFGSLISQILELQNVLYDKTPNIDLFGEPTPQDVNLYDERFIPSAPFATSNMACVIFANNPKHRTENNNAKSVLAEIAFLDFQRNVLLDHIQARWSETFQPSEISRGQWSTIESVELPNNGAKRSMVVLIKYPEDDYCYAFSNASYNFPLFENPDYVIKANHFIVQVRLKASYISDKLWEFEVETDGKGDTYKIRHGTEWQKTENSKATIKLPPPPPQIFVGLG